MFRLALACLGIITLCSCATILRSDQQMVAFEGGPAEGVTQVNTPDGTVDLEGGSGAFIMTRTKPDIQIGVVCPDGTTRNGVVETNFDWLLGLMGNAILNGGLGWLIDPFADNAFLIDDVQLQGYCQEPSD